MHEQGFATQSDKGRGQGIDAGMAEDHEARRAQQLVATLDEDLAPAMRAQCLPQTGGRTGDDHAAFVELGQCVAQAAARRSSLRARRAQRCYMAPIEYRLGQRKGEPDQRIEQVVPIVEACLDLTGQKGMFFIADRLRRRLDEPQRRAVAGDQLALRGDGVQRGEIGRAVDQPGLKKRRKRMKLHRA
ncbi:MAG: hypothetical protein Q8M11_23080 [Sulfuritalea sp.]|nr:hypothetical protein [Sulfuritalea sp.]MDP1982521.1 hypothetical protein [Sulfuritalea sp.]